MFANVTLNSGTLVTWNFIKPKIAIATLVNYMCKSFIKLTPEVLFAGTVKGWVLIIPTWLLTSIHENVMQSNLFNMDTKGAMESVDINGMSVLSSLNLERALFPQ